MSISEILGLLEELGVAEGVRYRPGMDVGTLERVAEKLEIDAADIREQASGPIDYRDRLRRTIKRALPLVKEIILEGALAGLSNAELEQAVHLVYPDSTFRGRDAPSHWDAERRNNTDWWQENAERLAEVRNIRKLEAESD